MGIMLIELKYLDFNYRFKLTLTNLEWIFNQKSTFNCYISACFKSCYGEI